MWENPPQQHCYPARSLLQLWMSRLSKGRGLYPGGGTISIEGFGISPRGKDGVQEPIVPATTIYLHYNFVIYYECCVLILTYSFYIFSYPVGAAPLPLYGGALSQWLPAAVIAFKHMKSQLQTTLGTSRQTTLSVPIPYILTLVVMIWIIKCIFLTKIFSKQICYCLIYTLNFRCLSCAAPLMMKLSFSFMHKSWTCQWFNSLTNLNVDYS